MLSGLRLRHPRSGLVTPDPAPNDAILARARALNCGLLRRPKKPHLINNEQITGNTPWGKHLTYRPAPDTMI